MEEENVLLEEKGIIITNQRAILGVNTYEISNIQSVKRIMAEHDEATKRKAKAMWLFGLIGFILVMVHICVINPSSRLLYWDERILEILGYIFLLIAAYIFMMGDVSTHFVVQISDNNGIHNAYQSKDGALIDKIVKVMNQAITERWVANMSKRDKKTLETV